MGCGQSSNMEAANNPERKETAAVNDEEDEELMYEQELNSKYERSEKRPEDNNMFVTENQEDGEQFMATKPWIGALKEPSNPPENNPEAPDENLELEFINGYRCEDSRHNVYYTSNSSEIAYMTASVGVLMSTTGDQKQKFLGGGETQTSEGHSDDISACAVSPCRTKFVTGQVGKCPKIIVWDLSNGSIICSGKLGRGDRLVKCITFSRDGSRIYAGCMDNDHSVYALDAATGNKLGSEKVGPDALYDMDSGAGSFAFGVVGAKRSVNLFTANMEKKRCLFGGNKMCDQASIHFFDSGDKFLTGAVTGYLYLWSGNSVAKTIAAHKGTIHSICIKDGKILTSGSRDRKIKIWDENFTEEKALDSPGYAKALDFYQGKIIAGTRSGVICEFNENGECKELINSHCDGEVWGLAVDKSGVMVTTSDDNKVVVFDPKARKTIATGVVTTEKGRRKKIGGASTLSWFPTNQCSRAVAINPNNGHVAIGTNEGEVFIRESVQNIDNNIARFKDAKEWIEVMHYSPDGSLLAVGSHDNKIYLYDVNNNYSRVGACSKNNSFITAFDFSTDGGYLQCVDGAYEYLFYDKSGNHLPGGATQFRDEEWASFTCKLGWPVQGVFPPYTDGSHVNGVDRSKSKKIFATGDDWGLVNIYRNPVMKGNKAKSYRAHSEHVVRVLFNEDDSYIYSVGGYDRCTMVWKLC